MDCRKRYRFFNHCDRLLLWQIETVEKERHIVNRTLRKNYRKSLLNRAVERVVRHNREYMTKIFLDTSRRV